MEYKGIKLTLDMDTKEMESAINRVSNSTKVFDNDIKKLKQNLKFDPSSIRDYNVMVNTLKNKFNETSNAVEYLKDFLNQALNTGRIKEYSSEYVNLSNKIYNLQKSLEITEKDLNNIEKEWKTNGSISKETIDNINKGLKLTNSTLEESGTKTEGFFSTLKALTSNEILSSVVSSAEKALKKIGEIFVKLGKGYINLMKQGVEYDALIQGYSTTIQTYLGDTTGKVTKKLVQDVRKIGIQFGFANDNLLEMAQTLLVSGVDANDVKKTIQSVVSSLSVFGKGNPELSRVSTNLLQIQTNGRATARDLREFANNGIPIYKMLADYSDRFTGDFEATTVTFQDILGAFQKAMEDENNILSKAGEVRQKTFNGQVDAMKARWQEFLGLLAEDTTSNLTINVLPAINKFLSNILTGTDDTRKKLIEQTGSVRTAIEEQTEGTMDDLSTKVANGLSTLVNEISDSGIIEDFLNGATMLVGAIGAAFDPDTTQGEANLEALKGLVKKALELVVDFIKTKEVLDMFVSAGIEIGKAIVGAIWDYINSNFEGISYGESGTFRIKGSNGGSGGYGNELNSLGFGALQSGGFTSNLTINVNTNQMITEQQVRGWASIINEELGQMV